MVYPLRSPERPVPIPSVRGLWMVLVALIVAYLLMATAPVLANLWPPFGVIMFVAASVVVLGGLWWFAWAWTGRPLAASSVALWLYLVVGLLGAAVTGLMSGVYSLALFLPAGAFGVLVLWRLFGWGRLVIVAVWTYLLAAFAALAASDVVAGEPGMASEGLFVVILWPTMLLWLFGCHLPLLTACPN